MLHLQGDLAYNLPPNLSNELTKSQLCQYCEHLRFVGGRTESIHGVCNLNWSKGQNVLPHCYTSCTTWRPKFTKIELCQKAAHYHRKYMRSERGPNISISKQCRHQKAKSERYVSSATQRSARSDRRCSVRNTLSGCCNCCIRPPEPYSRASVCRIDSVLIFK